MTYFTRNKYGVIRILKKKSKWYGQTEEDVNAVHILPDGLFATYEGKTLKDVIRQVGKDVK